jgi:hypothetical protein
MVAAEKEKAMEATRGMVQNWLMSDGWQLSEQVHPNMAWLIRAEDGGGKRILVGQYKDREDNVLLEANVNFADDYRLKFETLPTDRRREILWRLRFQLLAMNVDFVGVGEPLKNVVLTQRVYLDGLTKDAFIRRFLAVRNSILAVIWSIIQDLEGVEPPSESAENRTH